ncbi:MAG TPA: penicillin-binding protein 1A [Desulfobulbaceae bacterium]|nr:penicillin-binding protein 1A [Desulfobulbaceae bacterium]
MLQAAYASFRKSSNTTMSVPTVSSPKPTAVPKSPAGKTRVRRPVYNEKHIWIFLFVICLLQTFFLGTLLYILISLKIPGLSSVARYNPPQSTIIYDRHGRIVDRMFTEDRTVVPLNAMSPYLPKAFVAAEDGRFYDHPGLDLFSVLRAAVVNMRDGERSQGGSTITQQITKSLLLTPEKTYVRKFKEAILAWRIDKLLTKDEILYIYLNQIYLGEGAHGVEAAAQTYFGKSAAQLSLSESALLAGLPQAPSRYSLFDHQDRAVERQKYVLNRMTAEGYVSEDEAKAAYEQTIVMNDRTLKPTDENGYYLEAVKKRARAILGVPLQTAGAKIYTHLDSGLQENGAVAVRKGVTGCLSRQLLAGKEPGTAPQGGLVCIETATGRIRALIGGTSFTDSPFDRATQARRPAGSTFKPFVYAAALNLGWSPESPIEDSPLSIGRWSPQNYAGKYHGMTTLADALAFSLNTATVRIIQRIGYKEVHKIARNAGIRSNLPSNLSLALGSADVSILEMTAAYTSFAGNGTFVEPSFIERIITADGTVLVPEKDRKRQVVLNHTVLAQMRRMLKGVTSHGTGRLVADVPGVGGGKTGTSDNNRDAWFVGYDDKHTTGVWVGNDHNQPMGRSESGGTTAAPIWRDFMLAAQAM